MVAPRNIFWYLLKLEFIEFSIRSYIQLVLPVPNFFKKISEASYT